MGNGFIKRLPEFAGQACKVVERELNKLSAINRDIFKHHIINIREELSNFESVLQFSAK